MTQEKDKKDKTEEVKEQISNVVRIGRKMHDTYIVACVRALINNNTIKLLAKGVNITSAFVVATRLEKETGGAYKINQEKTRTYTEPIAGNNNRGRELTVVSITIDKIQGGK